MFDIFRSLNIFHKGSVTKIYIPIIRSKISTPTLKNPVLLFSASHTSSASNLTRTYISSQLDNKEITTNQNKNNTSNTDDIHSCVTPQKKNYSV